MGGSGEFVSDARYAAMLGVCHASIRSQYRLGKDDATELGVSLDALRSLRSQIYSRHIKKTTWRHRTDLDGHMDAFHAGRSIADIARR